MKFNVLNVYITYKNSELLLTSQIATIDKGNNLCVMQIR